MPLHYDVDHEKRRVTAVSTAPVELAEMVEFLERLAADGAWASGMLSDTRRLGAIDHAWIPIITEAALQIGETHGRRGPVAVVCAVPEVGMSQAYAIRVQRDQLVEVFWSRD